MNYTTASDADIVVATAVGDNTARIELLMRQVRATYEADKAQNGRGAAIKNVRQQFQKAFAGRK